MISLTPPIRRAALALMLGWATCAGAAAQMVRPVVVPNTCSPPVWPEGSLRNEEEGAVTLGLLVAPDGAVARVDILASSGYPALDEATVAGMSSCRMRPGTVGGSPAAMWYPVTFSWVRTSEPEDKRSLERTRAAAAQGDVKAQFAMATLYAYRAATDPSARAEQLDWLRKAAEGKLAMAQMHLGAAYELGIGVAQDEKEALRWYELAAAQGNVLAIERLRLGGIPSTVGPVPF